MWLLFENSVYSKKYGTHNKSFCCFSALDITCVRKLTNPLPLYCTTSNRSWEGIRPTTIGCMSFQADEKECMYLVPVQPTSLEKPRTDGVLNKTSSFFACYDSLTGANTPEEKRLIQADTCSFSVTPNWRSFLKSNTIGTNNSPLSTLTHLHNFHTAVAGHCSRIPGNCRIHHTHGRTLRRGKPQPIYETSFSFTT